VKVKDGQKYIYTVDGLLVFSWSGTVLAESVGYEGLIFFGSIRDTGNLEGAL